MKILIQIINHKDQRYETVGDWQFFEAEEGFGNTLNIYVSDLGNDKMNALVAIHELIEALLCRFNDPEIITEMVDKFDMEHPEWDEPGESVEAPYFVQHTLATHIEKELARWLAINWKEYEERINSL